MQWLRRVHLARVFTVNCSGGGVFYHRKASGKVEVVRPGLLVIDSPTNPNGNRLDQLSNLVEASSTTVSSQPPAEMEIGKQSRSMDSLKFVWFYILVMYVEISICLCVCAKYYQ